MYSYQIKNCVDIQYCSYTFVTVSFWLYISIYRDGLFAPFPSGFPISKSVSFQIFSFFSWEFSLSFG